MLYTGTDPASYITEYTLIYEDKSLNNATRSICPKTFKTWVRVRVLKTLLMCCLIAQERTRALMSTVTEFKSGCMLSSGCISNLIKSDRFEMANLTST